MGGEIPTYEVFALKVGEKHYDQSILLLHQPSGVYLDVCTWMWLILGGPEPIVVDTGFTPERARQKDWFNCTPAPEMLRRMGVDARDVRRVIMTHLHWDHLNGHRYFPNATFYIQRKELEFWTGPAARYRCFQQFVDPEHIANIVRLNFESRVVLLDGRVEFAPGITLHWVGGHTAGLQIVEVNTPHGTGVIASDVCHLYRNLEEEIPAGIIGDLPLMCLGWERVKALARPSRLYLPGHDFLALQRFPGPADGIAHLK